MKNIRRILFVLFFIFIFSVTFKVDALTVHPIVEPAIIIDENTLNVKEEGEEFYKFDGAYIIGSHMFTYEGSEKYDGILKTVHIMYAAMTIGINQKKSYIPTIDDMKVYYVDGNKVTDAFTGEKIENFTALIKYINLEDVKSDVEIDKSIEIPTLKYVHTDYNVENSEYEYQDAILYFSANSLDKPDFYQMAVSDSSNGYYVEADLKEDLDYLKHGVYIGNEYFYKVRSCNIIENEKVACSGWSNIQKIIVKPNQAYFIANKRKENEKLKVNFLTVNIYEPETPDGIELYKSNNENKGFNKIKTIELEKEEYYYLITDSFEGQLSKEEFENGKYAETYNQCDNLDNNAEHSNCYLIYEDLAPDFDSELFDTLDKDSYAYYKMRYYTYNDKNEKIYGDYSSAKFVYNPISVIDYQPTAKLENAHIFASNDDTDLNIKCYELYYGEYDSLSIEDTTLYDVYETKEIKDGVYVGHLDYVIVRGIVIKDGKVKYTDYSDVVYIGDYVRYEYTSLDGDEYTPAKKVIFYLNDNKDNIANVDTIYDMNNDKIPFKKEGNYYIINETKIGDILHVEVDGSIIIAWGTTPR